MIETAESSKDKKFLVNMRAIICTIQLMSGTSSMNAEKIVFYHIFAPAAFNIISAFDSKHICVIWISLWWILSSSILSCIGDNILLAKLFSDKTVSVRHNQKELNWWACLNYSFRRKSFEGYSLNKNLSICNFCS